MVGCRTPRYQALAQDRPNSGLSSVFYRNVTVGRPVGPFWSIASVWPDHGNFRSTPANGHSQDRRACLKGVESRCDAVALGSSISVAAPFVRRCLTGSTMAPFSHPAHRTGQADFPHPALGQNFTPSPTARRAQAGSGVRAQSARKDARVDRSRPCVAWSCA
jgi:hypothetical protein